MPKKMKAPSGWLLKKLAEKTAEFVRSNVDPFLNHVKRNGKGKRLTALQLLPDFFFWLGDRRRDFRQLENDQLNTNHKGTYQVYNYLRKKMEKIEEKPATPVPIAKAETPRRAPSPARIKKGKEEEEAVSMTATGHYQGHHEEKDVQYRRQMGSDQDDSEPEAGEEGFEEVEEEEEDVLEGKPKF